MLKHKDSCTLTVHPIFCLLQGIENTKISIRIIELCAKIENETFSSSLLNMNANRLSREGWRATE